ncbi:MAG: hypothetical protein ACTTKL_01260 [Treponema sp.]
MIKRSCRLHEILPAAKLAENGARQFTLFAEKYAFSITDDVSADGKRFLSADAIIL